MDVRKNTSLGNGDASKEFVEFFVVSDGKLDVSRNNSSFLVITGGVSCKLKDFGGKVFKNGSKVDRGTTSDTGGVFTLL